MTAFKYIRIVIFVVAELVATSSAEECLAKLDKQILCPSINRVPRSSGSISGIWYLYASTPMKCPNSQCGLFNTVYPCSCISAKSTSDCEADYTTNFWANLFGYNYETNVSSNVITVRAEQLETYDYSEIAQYTVLNTGQTFPAAVLGTDNKTSYVLVIMCNNPEGVATITGDKYIWFMSRTPVATAKSIREVNKILRQNGLSPKILKRVNQANCRYPFN